MSGMRTVLVPVPECPTCHAPYVLRIGISLITAKDRWYYQRDCKHKAVVVEPSHRLAPLDIPTAAYAQRMLDAWPGDKHDDE